MSGAYVPPAQDQTAMLREATVASLLAYGTLAGAAVESERIDVVQSGDMPRILVFADDSADSASAGGSAPALDVTATLVVQCLTERARRADAVGDIDALIAQVKDCLFGDPAWVPLSQNIASVRTTRSFKPNGERILGDARVQITCTWREFYPPRITTPLNTISLTVVLPD